MAAPGPNDIEAREGNDGSPNNDDDPCVGSISSNVIADNAVDVLFNSPPFSDSEETYYGGFYYVQLASGFLDNARAYNRCALLPNPMVGTLTFGFINGLNAGNKLWVQSLVGEEVQSEYVTCPSAAGFVSTVKTYDAEAPLFIEYVNSTGNTAVPISPITVSQTGVDMGLMRGTSSNRAGGKDLAVRQLHTFLKLALCTAKNTTVSLSNRRTIPPVEGTLSAFGRGRLWAGIDESLAVPSNTLDQDDYIAVIGELILPAGFTTPAYGKIQTPLLLIGSAKT